MSWPVASRYPTPYIPCLATPIGLCSIISRRINLHWWPGNECSNSVADEGHIRAAAYSVCYLFQTWLCNWLMIYGVVTGWLTVMSPSEEKKSSTSSTSRIYCRPSKYANFRCPSSATGQMTNYGWEIIVNLQQFLVDTSHWNGHLSWIYCDRSNGQFKKEKQQRLTPFYLMKCLLLLLLMGCLFFGESATNYLFYSNCKSDDPTPPYTC